MRHPIRIAFAAIVTTAALLASSAASASVAGPGRLRPTTTTIAPINTCPGEAFTVTVTVVAQAPAPVETTDAVAVEQRGNLEGEVELGIDGEAVETAPLTNGVVTFEVPNGLDAGTHALTAYYAGSGRYASSDTVASVVIIDCTPPVVYDNCDAVRAAGKAPLLADQPGYTSKLDGDGDGVACEGSAAAPATPVTVKPNFAG
jgi:hypothetical protein